MGNPVQLVRVPELGVPRAGVTNVGDVAKTKAPEPVSSETAVASCAEVAVNVLLDKFIVLLVSVSVVALPTKVSVEVGNVNVPVLTIELITGAVSVLLVSVSVVALPTKVSVEVGNVSVPVLTIELITGVVKVGDVPKTSAPEPVSPVTAAAKFALLGVAKNVATLAPNPLTPVEMGNPVQLVKVPEVGVPNAGVTNVNDSA